MNDAALTRLFLRFRDQHRGSALAAVFDALARELIEVACHLSRDIGEAEDLVQSTFRIAIERAASFDGERSLRGWLYGILAREAARSNRDARRHVDTERLAVPQVEQPLDSLIRSEVPQVLRGAVDRLPPPYREVVDQVVCAGRSSGDVALDLGRAPGTVRVQLQRGIERLRRLFPREYAVPAVAALRPGGLRGLREHVLRQGCPPGAGSPTAVGIAAESALAVAATTPALGLLPLAAVLALVPWLARSPAPLASAPTEVSGPVDSIAGEAAAPSSLDDAYTPAAEGREIAPVRATKQERVPVQPATRHPDRAQVAGIVLDEADQPVPGVVVRGTQDPDHGYPVKFLTDSAGRFSFAGLAEGWWFFSVDRPDRAVVWWRKFGAHVKEASPERPEQVELYLYAPRSTNGVVVDESGQPVADVQVTLAVERVDGEGRPVQGHLESVQVTTTDAAGQFTFERLSPGEMLVVLDHPRYARTLGSFRTDSEAVRLTLERGGVLEGRVLADGVPLEGIRVRAMAPSRSGLPMGEHEATTAADGSFRIERVHSFFDAGYGIPTLVLSLLDEEWTSAAYWVYESDVHVLPPVTIAALPAGTEPDPARIDVGRNATREAEIAGEPGGESSVVVRFAGAAELPDDWSETVWLRGLSGGLEEVFRQERTAGDRTALFGGLAAGRYRVWVLNSNEPNYQPAEVEVPPGGERVEVTLAPGAITLRGQIRCGGSPVPDIEVFLTGSMRAKGQVDPDGYYEVHGLVPGTYELSTWAESAFENHFRIEVPETAPGEWIHHVELPRGELAGTVRDVDFPNDPEVQVFPRGWGTSAGNRGSRASVDPDGRFHMRFIPPGEYVAFLWSTRPRAVPVPVEIRPGEVRQIVLAPPTRTTTVSGNITNPRQTAAGRRRHIRAQEHGTALMLVGRDAQGYLFGISAGYAEVGPDGSFLMEDVEPGDYGLLVSNHRNGLPTFWIPNVHVPASGLTDLAMTLPPSRAVRIVLEPGDVQTSQSIWHLRVPSGDRIPFYSFIGTQPRGLRAGPSEFHLPLGNYVVEADFGDGGLVASDLEVTAGHGALEVVVRLK